MACPARNRITAHIAEAALILLCALFIIVHIRGVPPLEVSPSNRGERDGILMEWHHTTPPAIAIIFLASICGYLPALMSFLIIFIYKTCSDAAFAYSAFIYLIAASMSYSLAKHRWYRTLPGAILAGAALAAVMGGGWIFLLGVINAQEYDTARLAFALRSAVLPCQGVALLLFFLFRAAPDGCKERFAVSALYTHGGAPERERFSPGINYKIIACLVTVSFVLCISAAGFANILMTQSIHTGISLFDPHIHDFAQRREVLAFDVRLILLMMNATIPIAVLINAYAQGHLAAPIKKMAEYMVMFGSLADAGRQECIEYIRSLDIHTHDEIEDLHHALVATIGQINDYIEQLKTAQKLETELAVAKAESEAKSDFLSNMSHEIRTPINSVLGLDEMILRESHEQEIITYAADIKNAGHTLLNLINDILDFSKLSVGKMQLIPVEYELSSTINDLANMIQQRAKEKGLEFSITVDRDIPHRLVGDEIRLKQIILNILTNAVKYTAAGSVTLALRFSKCGEQEIMLAVSVTDTGIGIKKEDISKLANPFQRIDEKRNRTIEGTGLGMSIVTHLLALMDSQIQVDSEYGKGSEFSFSVRQQVADWEPMGDFNEMHRKYQEATSSYRESFHAPNARILVVDDTKLNLTVIRGLLKQTQIQVDTADGGMETLRMVAQKKYDLIFIDHRMPIIDGIETLHAMQKMQGNVNQGIPCIALTANAIVGAKEMYLKAGFTDYLAKPVEGKRLEAMICRYLPPELVQEVPPDAPQTALLPEDAAFLEQLANVPGIDAGAALQNCATPAILRDAIREFQLAITQKADDIATFAASHNYMEYTTAVHALKSSARLIGALKLSERARQLEACGRDIATGKAASKAAEAQIQTDTPPLLEAYRAYQETLAPFACPISTADKPLISFNDLQDALNGLQGFVEAFDFDSADNIMHILEEYRMPDTVAPTVSKLRELLSAVNRDGILALLKEQGKASV